MRLHPEVSSAEALGWLTREATASFDVPDTPELQAALKPLADAMAAVSAVVLPDELEPRVP
jgi:hypothetical protein